MTGLDVIAGVILGLYLLTVAVRGNGEAFLDLAKRDKGFLPWAIAVAVLAYLYHVKELRGVVGMLILVAIVAFGIQAGKPFQDNIKKLWTSLKSPSKEDWQTSVGHE